MYKSKYLRSDYRASFCVCINGRATWLRHVGLNDAANTYLGAKRQAYKLAKQIGASKIELYYSPNPWEQEGVFWRGLASRSMDSRKWENYR